MFEDKIRTFKINTDDLKLSGTTIEILTSGGFF